MNKGVSVSVNNITRRFGDFTAVDNVSLEIAYGEIYGFIGPNGSGKSTMIRMLCGLLLPTSGSGTVAGYDIVAQAEEIKKNIGYMSQRFSLYDDLTVQENIDFFSGIYSIPAERRQARKDWALSLPGIGDRKHEAAKNLAAGFKQRLALGCAVLHEPKILFLDEPTSGVDPLSRRDFWDLIYSLARGGTTVFVTTHYLDEADYCDRLGLIYRGKMIAQGTPGDLRRNFMKKEVIEISVDRLVDALDILARGGIEAAVFGNVLHATVTHAEREGPEIKRILESAGIVVRGWEKIIPSLEDVFVTMIEVS